MHALDARATAIASRARIQLFTTPFDRRYLSLSSSASAFTSLCAEGPIAPSVVSTKGTK